MFANWPIVASGSYALSLDGTTLTYLDVGLATVSTVTFAKQYTNITFPVNVTMCASDGEATYVVAITDLSISATKTPYNPNTSITSAVYSKEFIVQSTVAFSDLFYVSSDLMASIEGSRSMATALGPALYPPVLSMISNRSQAMYVTLLAPSTLTDVDGATTFMSTKACNECILGCPTYCALSIITGDQVQFTSKPWSMDGAVKAYGETNFSATSNVSYPLLYSGNVSLNIARFQLATASNLQPVKCTTEATVRASAGRYCLLTGQSIWSVLEVSPNATVMASTYRPSAGRYYGFVVWSPRTIFAVAGELGLSSFLGSNIKSLPDKVPASNRVISAVQSAVVSGNQLVLITDAGALDYTSEACTGHALLSLPWCPAMAPFAVSMASSRIVTVSWVGSGGSNWGSGFVAAGYKVRLQSVMRSLAGGASVNCSMEGNSNPLCSAVCQPTTETLSLELATALTYLSVQSWLPDGSTLNGKSCGAEQCGDYPFRFYGTASGSVIITVETRGAQYVVWRSSAATADVFGVALKCSYCFYYNLPTIVAQPFEWIAILAVKSLLVTLVFYYCEQRVRQGERRRVTFEDREVHLRAQLADARQRMHDENSQATEFSEDSTFSNSPAVTAGLGQFRRSFTNMPVTDADVAELELELAGCEAEHQRFGTCLLIPNILDKITSLIGTLGAFLHPVDRAAFVAGVRANLLATELHDMDLADLLQFVLKEDRSNKATVAAFALFYEWNMCNHKSWVIRQRPHRHAGSSGLSSQMASELDEVHCKLREVYSIFKESQLAAMQAEGLRRLEATSEAQNVGWLSRLSFGSETARSEAASLCPIPEASGWLGSVVVNNSDGSAKGFLSRVAEFNELHTTKPNCFEYAVLSSMLTNAQLQPSTNLLALSLAQSVITLFLYVVDVLIRSRPTPMTPLQVYQSVYFLIFNSSLPSTLLVNAVFHADLSPNAMATTVTEWFRHIFQSPFVVLTLCLLAPGLVTHVIPGLGLYGWALLPPLALVIGAEFVLRRTARRPSKKLVAARVCTRVAVLFATAIVFSVAFNLADAFLWQRLPGAQPFATGSYTQQSYYEAMVHDYKARSLHCSWEHLLDSISNFLQMGFFLV